MLSFNKKLWLASPLLLMVNSCAIPTAVQRIGVDYNTAAAGMADELTLLNIVRAKDGLPLHYTTIGRLTGSLTLRASTGLNVQFKESATTKTDTTTTAAAISEVVTKQVLSGGDIVTPSIAAEVNTGPSFDISILDSQEFYQGILSGIPFTTVVNFLYQGYDSSTIMALLIDRIEFRLKNKADGIPENIGEVILSLTNNGGENDTSDFARVISCFILNVESTRPPGVPLVPLSRIAGKDRGKDDRTRNLTIADIALLDGKNLDLSDSISTDPAFDAKINIVRPSTVKQVGKLTKSKGCKEESKPVNGRPVTLPAIPPADRTYAGAGQVLVLAPDGKSGQIVDADMSVIFRSPEGLIQFLGRCLHRSTVGFSATCIVGSKVLFSLREGGNENSIVSTRLYDRKYSIPNDQQGQNSMFAIGLVERLINLQKKAIERPVTVPVQIVP